MSGSGRPGPQLISASGLRVGIVASRWHAETCELLIQRAIATAESCGAQYTLARVPGAVELPVLAQQLASNHDAVVALGVVIRGETPHFDFVCRSLTDGLTRVSLDTGTPVAHGVLTTSNEQQVRDRDGHPGAKEDKGAEAVLAALAAAVELIRLQRGQP